MLSFEPIAIKNKSEVARHLCFDQFGSTEGSFADLYIWGELYGTQICIQDGTLYIRAGGGNRAYYLYPYGNGDLSHALDTIRQDAKSIGAAPELRGITERMRANLESAAPGTLIFKETRDTFDYIYDAKELIELQGKKFHQKRNHVNKFKKTYEDRYSYEIITEENLPEVYEFQKRWLAENITPESETSLKAEMRAIERGFEKYTEIGFIGGILRIDGQIAAYSMGTRLCDESFLVSVEKGDYKYEGIYQIINQLFAEKNCSEVKYINREDDTGSPGLRKAKLSYKPVILLKKYKAAWKDVSV